MSHTYDFHSATPHVAAECSLLLLSAEKIEELFTLIENGSEPHTLLLTDEEYALLTETNAAETDAVETTHAAPAEIVYPPIPYFPSLVPPASPHCAEDPLGYSENGFVSFGWAGESGPFHDSIEDFELGSDTVELDCLAGRTASACLDRGIISLAFPDAQRIIIAVRPEENGAMYHYIELNMAPVAPDLAALYDFAARGGRAAREELLALLLEGNQE